MADAQITQQNRRSTQQDAHSRTRTLTPAPGAAAGLQATRRVGAGSDRNKGVAASDGHGGRGGRRVAGAQLAIGIPPCAKQQGGRSGRSAMHGWGAGGTAAARQGGRARLAEQLASLEKGGWRRRRRMWQAGLCRSHAAVSPQHHAVSLVSRAHKWMPPLERAENTCPP